MEKREKHREHKGALHIQIPHGVKKETEPSAAIHNLTLSLVDQEGLL